MENFDAKIEKMPTLEVEFELPTIEEEVSRLTYFCRDRTLGGLNWSGIVYRQHPELKKIVEGVADKDEFYSLCYEYVKDYLENNRKSIEESKNDFQKSWNEINDSVMSTLSEDFEVSYPENIGKVKAKISINPICPRNVHEWSFSLFYKFSDLGMKKTGIHELIHFFYFKKWAEIFPDCDKKEFDGPHSVWRLSEILVVSIMNANKKIQNIINGEKSFVYKDWQDIKIDDQNLADYFETFYREHLEPEGKISFADFLRKSWEEYQKYKNQIEEGVKNKSL